MTMIPSQPFEVRDFTGGITDNFIQGEKNQYMSADNFILTTDGKLASRPGSVILDSTNYRLPDTLHGKVDFMGGWLAELLILAQGSKSLYILNPNWAEVFGPTGNKAFPYHAADNKISTGEWNRHYYLTPDSGSFPIKLYKDFSGTIQMRTAGLPQPVTSNTLTDAAKLTAAIALANELKTKMLAHMNDYNDGVLVSWAHATKDTTDIGLVNAAGNASDLPSLVTLTAALKAAYNGHLTDAFLFSPNQVYHANAYQQPQTVLSLGLGTVPTLNLKIDTTLASPTTLTTCVAILNDLRNRFNWHTWATATHVNAYNFGINASPTGFGAHATSFSTIATTSGPTFSGQIQVLLSYVNHVKEIFNNHLGNYFVSGSGVHNNPDLANIIQLPDATDLWGIYAILGHLEYFYWEHFKDANYVPAGNAVQPYFFFQGTVTSGSAQITAMTPDPNGVLFTINPVTPPYIVNRSGPPGTTNANQQLFNQNAGFYDVFPAGVGAVVSSIDSTTQVTVNKNATQSNPLTLIMSYSRFHFDIDQSAGAVTSPAAYNIRMNALDASLQDVQGLVDETQFIVGLLKSHETSLFDSKDGTDPVYTPYTVYVKPTTFPSLHYAPHEITFDESTGFVWPSNYISVGVDYFTTPPLVVDYLYVLCWRYDYKIDSGTSFENISTPSTEYLVTSFVSAAAAVPLQNTALDPVTLTNLPILVNDTTTNYDTSALVLDIYKTIGNGDTFYLAGTVANGVTTFVDSSLDSILITNQQLYTTGGVSFNDQPPVSKFMTILNTTAYFASIVDTGQSLLNRVRQSNDNAPDSCPATFFDDLDEAITGMNSVKNNVVVFSKNSIYRMEGVFNILGQGQLAHERISSTIGSVNNSGIVKTEEGLFFAGNDGFYFTDGFQFVKLSKLFDSYYAALVKSATQRGRIYATYDKLKKRIIWAVQTDPTGTANDAFYVLHLNYGVKPDAVFTTWSNLQHFRPTSVLFFEGTLYRGDERGYIFKHDDSVKTDPKVNTTIAATSWQKVYLPWNYSSCSIDFETTFVRKWAPRMSLTGKNAGNANVQIQSDNDNGKNLYSLTPMNYKPNPMWGQPDVIWGTSSYKWKYDTQLDQWRRFTAGSLRCNFKQVIFTPAKSVIYASETYGNALCNINAPAKTCTLTTPSGFTSFIWPLDLVDYVVAFQADGYVKEYTITAMNTTTSFTYSDPNNTSVTANAQNWVIRGMLKEAALSLTSYVLHWAPLGLSMQPGFHSSDNGENV